MQQDDSGATHIYGEFHNETDVQATQMRLSGKLLDAWGNVIAEAEGPICPPDSPPHSQNAFDIKFPQPVPRYSSFQVHAIAGKTLDAPLLSPNITVAVIDAARTFPPDPTGPMTVYLMLRLDNQSPIPYGPLDVCVALYDPSGQVVGAYPSALIEYHPNGGSNGILDTDVPESFIALFWHYGSFQAVQLRAWVWLPGREGGPSRYQFVMTDKVTMRLAPQ